jgi:sodium transport system ATP-binding protein
MIEVEGLGKVYTGTSEPVEAIREVTFTARPGTIFGLLGPNGAGKTTTLRIISTVLRPTRGSVRVDGVDVVERPQDVRRRIGFLSASTALYERLTPRELLEYFGRLGGLSAERIAARTEELCASLDMGTFVDRYCGLLSSGQKQKASIARALLHDPPVLVFDEPTAALDVLVARTLVEQISALRDARRTIVLSTHIMAEAERLCDEVGLIHAGRMIAQGTLDEVRDEAGAETLEDAFFELIGRQSAEPHTTETHTTETPSGEPDHVD